MTTLDLVGIGHRFADTPPEAPDTLSAVDLAIGDGELVAVVGPSGSGKTTLLRVAAGLTAPVRGEVRLAGAPVTHLPPERRDLTVMFQEPHLFAHLDVTGNVAFGPRMRGVPRREARERARRYLDLVHLAGLGGRRPGRLSGGQQQRVALARALATERGVLLLDEPFSALDPDLRGTMHDLLAEVRTELSPTVLMVTHDVDEAALADRVAVLVAGRLEQLAPVDELQERPASLAVARLLGGFQVVTGEVVQGTHRSRWGRVVLPAACGASGSALLLLRREELRLVGPDEPPGAFRLPGTVVATRRRGARTAAVVEPDGEPVMGGDQQVEVELPLGGHVAVGTSVVAGLDARARPWAVTGSR